MIALRIAAAALMVSAAPLRSGAQESLPDIGTIPSDWSEYARALAVSNRHREAIAAYERAMLVKSARADDCAWAIARLYAQLGNHKQAERWAEHARELSDGPMLRRGSALIKATARKRKAERNIAELAKRQHS